MSNRPAYALAAILISGVILADAAGFPSLYANLILMSLAAILLIYGGVSGNASLSDWFQAWKAERQTSHGRISSMVMSIESAERGYWHSREDLARILAEASAVKRGRLLKPDYDATMKERDRLMAVAAIDEDVREVFEVHPSDSPIGPRFRRKKDEAYLSALEAAIALVGARE